MMIPPLILMFSIVLLSNPRCSERKHMTEVDDKDFIQHNIKFTDSYYHAID